MTRGKITYLDGIRLHRALTAGIRRVLSRQDHLNRINRAYITDTGAALGVHAGPGSLILALLPARMDPCGIEPA